MRQPPAFVAVALALCGAAHAQQFLIMPDSTNNRVVTFSPVDGSVINSNLFAIASGTTPISAIDVNDEIWISEQNGDKVSRYDLAGASLGVIGPAHGGGVMDNIRGLTLVGSTVYVTNSGTGGGAPGNAVILFDTAGTYLSQFSTTGTCPSPFSVLAFQGDLLVAGSSGTDDVHRYTLAGAPLGTFHNTTQLAFAHQLALASDGNVWCGGFTTNNVVKLDATNGAVLLSFAASGARGVYELSNGNVMWTNGSGAHVYDVTTLTSTMVYPGGGRHLNLYTVGSGGPGAPVVYCTAGTTTNNCSASISASAQPSVSFASPCQIDVANIEGQKLGLVFYSVDNTGFAPLPWGAGTSFLCVKSPTQRSATQNSNGTAGQCDGAFTLDWNAFQIANPGSLGNPFSTGNKVYLQAWFRDPPASKTTNLSDAVELTCIP